MSDWHKRSAAFLLAIGEQRAAKVLQHLDVREVRAIGHVMAEMRSVPPEIVSEALSEFREASRNPVVAGSPEYLRHMLVDALGERQGEALLAKILPNASTSLNGVGPGLANLRLMDARSIAELMRHEHPQVVAVVLALIETDLAGDVVEFLPEELAFEALHRMATTGQVQPGALRELSEALNEQFSSDHDAFNTDSFGGVGTTAEVLNRLEGKRVEKILSQLKEQDAELAQKVEDLMFVFGDLIGLDDRGMQLLLREVESSTLLLAIKDASEELREKIFRNMSSRAAEILRDDLEARGPVRLSEVQAAQKEVLRIARGLEEQGQIVLHTAGSEEMI